MTAAMPGPITPAPITATHFFNLPGFSKMIDNTWLLCESHIRGTDFRVKEIMTTQPTRRMNIFFVPSIDANIKSW